MSTRQQTIYEIRVEPLLPAEPGQPVIPTLSYYSNLKKTVETLQAVLATQGWTIPFNYTAVYRELKLRDRYAYTFRAEGVRYFHLTITRLTLNPNLTTLGIEEMPRPRRSA